jgi:hypothetical protein
LRTLDSEKAKRQAKFIIEVPDRAKHREFPGEDGGNHLLRGRLADTPGHADDRTAPLPPHVARQVLQSFDCRLHPDDIKARGQLNPRPFNNNAGSFPFDSLLDEVVPVESGSFDREEKVTLIQGSRVDRVAPDFGISTT